MKKIVLVALVAISCVMARDCRYEEQELNSLIRQYEDLKDDYKIAQDQIFRRAMFNKDKISETISLENQYKISSFHLKQRIE